MADPFSDYALTDRILNSETETKLPEPSDEEYDLWEKD